MGESGWEMALMERGGWEIVIGRCTVIVSHSWQVICIRLEGCDAALVVVDYQTGGGI